jgi:hypothetical protein
MTMIYTALGALALSAIPILLLCMGDPKRRRTIGIKGDGMATRQRRLLAAAACIPGVACIWVGDAPAFLMWLGGCALLGWALAACFRGRGEPG